MRLKRQDLLSRPQRQHPREHEMIDYVCEKRTSKRFNINNKKTREKIDPRGVEQHPKNQRSQKSNHYGINSSHGFLRWIVCLRIPARSGVNGLLKRVLKTVRLKRQDLLSRPLRRHPREHEMIDYVCEKRTSKRFNINNKKTRKKIDPLEGSNNTVKTNVYKSWIVTESSTCLHGFLHWIVRLRIHARSFEYLLKK